jgi:hypothetical protein
MIKPLVSHKVKISSALICFLIFMMVTISGFSQNAGISDPGAVPPTGSPNTSAGLDINFTNKGLLIPRVALTGAANTTVLNPITAPVAGMIVYNTATITDVTPGFYFNNGTRWVEGLPKANAAGDMQYWDGASWKNIPVGGVGQRLQLNASGIPVWAL